MQAVFDQDCPDLGMTDENVQEFLSTSNEIESRFFMSLLELPITGAVFNGSFVFWYDSKRYELTPQHIDMSMSKRYRADFVLYVFRYDNMLCQIIIEIDGHDYHNLTKEQAQRDRTRDREFAKKGYTVLRFTGSEVFVKPILCWQEILDTSIQLIEYKLLDYRQ
jgi:very-short-patch-repair endonuclease